MERLAIATRRRFRRRPYRTLAFCLALVALTAARLACRPSAVDPTHLLAEGSYRLMRVIDGDTIIVGPQVTIRLIGVDTPETVKPEHPVEPFGLEATAFTREFLSGGSARLTFDRERLDRYGRQLAYVWVGERMLNEELVRQGLARFEPRYHYSEAMKRRFRQAQQEAQQAGRGLWSPAGEE